MGGADGNWMIVLILCIDSFPLTCLRVLRT